MVEAFGGRALRQKERTKQNQTFLKRESGEKSEQIPLAFSCLKCSYSVGLWVTFSFPLRLNLMSCVSKAEPEQINGF